MGAPIGANVAWIEGNHCIVRPLDRHPTPSPKTNVPLGSLWKLFVYLYLSEKKSGEPIYECSAEHPSPEDRYCCESGGSIDRDGALAHSCAPYFDPKRLRIRPNEWKTFWTDRHAPQWLTHLENLTPSAQVSIEELLKALLIVPEHARTEARNALLETSMSLYGKNVWTDLGSGIRYKTFSWHRDSKIAYGGAAGWLADGTPFWFGSDGSSASALTKWGKKLSTVLPLSKATSSVLEQSCVDVDFFERYPLREIWDERRRKTVDQGYLQGNYRLHFANGNYVRIHSNGHLRIQKKNNDTPKIIGRIGLNDYVARVIDREGNTTEPEAARALAIAARTYLVQNGHFQGGCWHIADSSRTQRASASEPSVSALQVASFTDSLILSGAPIHYHSNQEKDHTMSWSSAYKQASQGWKFDKILRLSYPKTTIVSLNGKSECLPMSEAEQWLNSQKASWEKILENEPGYETPEPSLRVCRLEEGNPYSDQKRMRIYVRGWRSFNERITLTHEYLHLAFRYYPSGSDESYIERLARKLTGATP